jgi:hypothetical protein
MRADEHVHAPHTTTNHAGGRVGIHTRKHTHTHTDTSTYSLSLFLSLSLYLSLSLSNTHTRAHTHMNAGVRRNGGQERYGRRAPTGVCCVQNYKETVD